MLYCAQRLEASVSATEEYNTTRAYTDPAGEYISSKTRCWKKSIVCEDPPESEKGVMWGGKIPTVYMAPVAPGFIAEDEAGQETLRLQDWRKA